VVPEGPQAEAPERCDIDETFRRFAPYVARIGMRILGAGADVDDLVQEVFLDAQRGLEGLKDPNAVRHWLATIAVRKARRTLLRRRRWRWVGLEGPETEPLLAESLSPETRAALIAVYRILDGVSPDARLAWIMHRVEDQPLDRVAEMCNCSRATAHRRVVEAQRALKEGLTDVWSK
jgi:RNA polymerase sigma-70 factor (ECF subfamily)